LFDQSIRAAANEGFFPEEGLAYERLGLYHSQELGNALTATPYLARARDTYKCWGADILVDRMDKLMHTELASLEKKDSDLNLVRR
jgi:hypothetical protein